jgi:hypothetical protein
MNDKSGGYRPRPARSRWLGVLVAGADVALLAACSGGGGGGPSATASSSVSSAYTKALAYAQCIRAHGVPSYPDPNSKGQFVIQNGSNDPTANVSTTVLNAADKACRKLLPPAMAQGPSAQGQGSTTSELKFAECMRSHGEPNFPDPASNGSFTLPAGMNAESPQFKNAGKACQSLMPSKPGGQAP